LCLAVLPSWCWGRLAGPAQVVVAVLLLAVTAGVLSLESSAKTSAPPKPLLYRCHAMYVRLRDGAAP
jgi:hypothetical protein